MISSHLSRTKYDLLFVERATGPGVTLVIGEDGAESQWRSALLHIRIGEIVACGSQAEKVAWSLEMVLVRCLVLDVMLLLLPACA